MTGVLIFILVFFSSTHIAYSSPTKNRSHFNYKNLTRNEEHIIHKRFTNEGYSIVPLEFYKNPDYYQMLSYIFNQMKFTNKQCEVTFQNCLLDLNNKRFVKGYDIISDVCFPLQKSRFCLEEQNFRRSECAYFTIFHRAQKHFARLSLNLETCLRKYPIELSSTQLGNNNSSSIYRSRKLLNKYFIFIYILLLCFNYCKLFI